MIASAENDDKFALTGITAGKAYNSMQQRIRAQARKMDFKVVIRFDAQEEKLYFKASRNEMTNANVVELGVKSSEIKSIKTNAGKVSTK